MILVILTALAAVCSAAKLDKSYLPPISARTAGGSPGALVAPLESNQGLSGLPTGSYTNDAQGVIVDAVNPGTRTSGLEPTGLGGPRASYGSTDSKVGEAAFIGSGVGFKSSGVSTRIAPGFGSFVESDETRGVKSSGATLKFKTDVGQENYSYGFETDNGISVGENGVAANGVQAEGAYSYKGDDGKTYSVTYTADEGGYKPQGQHLPTPHPIPEEILISLKKNAKEEAAGHVDDGSYNEQKYNDGGDYSSNSAGSNNVRPIIGGLDATSSGSYVSQSNQAHRPTSGVLVGSYNPGNVASFSQGQGAQDSGIKQSSFVLNKDQSVGVLGSNSFVGGQFGQASSSNVQDSSTLGSHSHGAQTVFSSQSTENRFGVQATKSESTNTNSQGTVAGSPVRTTSFHSLPSSSAYSSAVATGSGSASAFASTGALDSGLKNSFGSAGQHILDSKSGSDSAAGASISAPSSAEASASVSESHTQQYSGSQQVNSESQHSGNALTVVPLPSASATASISGDQNSKGQSNQQYNAGFNTEPNLNAVPSRFGEVQQSGNSITNSGYLPPVDSTNPIDSSSAASAANVQPLSVHSSQISSTILSHQGFNSVGSAPSPTLAPFTSFTNSGPIHTTFTPSTQKPSISQYQGSDSSYHYNQPSKPFVIPSSQYSYNRQPNFPVAPLSLGSKFPNTPTTAATGQYQGTSTSSYNGVTQATISSFNSGSSSTQTASQSSQFGLKPSTQFGQSISSQQTSTNFGATGSQFGQKPIVQSQLGQSSNNQNSQSSTQQYQGTLYQYNKPAETLPAQAQKESSSSSFVQVSQTDSQAKPSQVFTDSRFGSQQGSSQFGSQSSFQQSQTGSNKQPSYYSQTPIVSSQTSGINYQPSQIGSSGSQFGQKLPTAQGSIFSSNSKTESQQSQFGIKPIGSTQSVSYYPQTTPSSISVTTGQTPFDQKPVVSTQTTSVQQSGLGSSGSQVGLNPHTTQGSSFTSNTYSQSQASQFTNKPSETSQTGSTIQQTQLGSAGSPVGQNSQFNQGSRLPLTTVKPTFGQQPFGSSYQQTQFGSTGSQFGSKPQTTQGSSFTSNTYSKGQTPQFGIKPVGTIQTGSSLQKNQYGSTGFQFGQNAQSNQGSGLASTTFKPSFGQNSFGSSYQQTQFGSTGTQFGQNSQPALGSSVTSTTTPKPFTIKPVYQQTQFGAAGTQFGKNPVVSTIQTGSTLQQTQFGSTASRFGESSQSNQGFDSSTTTSKPSLVQKPFGTSYQQTQFGSTSQFGSKPQISQGSSFASNQYSQSQTSQFGKNPVVSSTPTGSQFGQSLQYNQGFGSTTTTSKPSFVQKPFGTSYQQTQFGSASQFGSKPQTSQGSSFTSNQYSQSQTSQFGKNPVVTTTQTGSQFGQSSQYNQGFGSTTTTSKPSFVQKPFGSSYQQTQFGSASQFGSKPQTTQGSSFVSNKYSQIQTSQFGKNPVVSTTQTGSQFGQSSQSNQGFGSSATTSKPTFGQKPFSYSYQQPQFGSQFGSKPQTTQGTSYTSNTYSQTQTSQFGKKPVSTIQTGSTSQQNQFGSIGFQSGQNAHSNQGLVSTTSKPSFDQKPFGSSYQQTQFGSTGSRFGQTSESGQSSGVTSTTTQTPFAIKPVYQQAQFGSSSSQLSQSSQTNQSFGSSTTTSKPTFGQKPFGSSYQQTQFGSTDSQFGSKPQTTLGSTFTSNTYSQSQTFGKKPENTYQQLQSGSTGSQFGSNSVSNQGSNSQTSFGIKPVYQQPQFGSAVSQPQSATQGLSYTSSTGSKDQTVQTSQYGLSSTSQNSGPSTQNAQTSVNTGGTSQNQFVQTSQSGVTPFGSSSTSGSSFQQTQFSSGSQFGQAAQAQPVQTTQNEIKPVGLQVSQIGSVPSRFGETSEVITTVSQTAQPTQFGQKPVQTQFESTIAQLGTKPQAQANAFAFSSSPNIAAQFGSAQANQVSKYQQTQFGVQNQGLTSTQKPSGTSLVQNNYSQYQYTQGNQPQYSQVSQSNVGNGQFGQSTFGTQSQKPFGSQSTQTTYQQTYLNQGQKPIGSTVYSSGQAFGEQHTQSNVQTNPFGSVSSSGYNYQKPQTVFTTQYVSQANGPQDQKVQQTQTNFNSVVSTTPTPLKPVSLTSANGNLEQTQSTVASSQIGVQPTKVTGVSGPVVQTTYNQFSGQHLQPVSTVSTQVSGLPSQSTVGTSQFGVQPTQPAHVTHFSGQQYQTSSTHASNNLVGSKPEYVIQPAPGTDIGTSQSHLSVEPYNPVVNGQNPSIPNRVSSNINGKPEGIVVSSVQEPIVPIPGYEFGTSQGIVGLGEQFGGPRDPPRFDEKTGYHY